MDSASLDAAGNRVRTILSSNSLTHSKYERLFGVVPAGELTDEQFVEAFCSMK